MNIKNLVGIIIVVAVAAVGYFMFMPKMASSPSTTGGQDSMTTPEGSPASAGKLNINAICQGALAYMTFNSGAEAEAFVQECKDGKHPEVIEKYKKDHGFGDGAAI